jgi:hypothetical protein
MKELKFGTITIILPAEIDHLDDAGKLDPLTVSRIVKTPAGIGQACLHAADSIDNTPGIFTPPAGVTSASLREAGQKAEKIDQILQDLESAKTYVSQSSLIHKKGAYVQLRKVNDEVKAQGKYNRECYSRFGLTRKFFRRQRVNSSAGTELQENTSPASGNGD